MTEEAAFAKGMDHNDAANEFGDDAVLSSINKAIPQPKFPAGFTMNAKGLLIVKDAIAPLETILTK